MKSERRKSHSVKVGKLSIGSAHPILVQSMTNTDTEDIAATSLQICQLAQAGSEWVRITVNTPAAAAAVEEICMRVIDSGVEVPLIGDFHYNGHKLLTKTPGCARSLDKYRINPGNVGQRLSHDANFKTMIEVAMEYDKAIRIGVNWGSLDQGLLAERMDANARLEKPSSAEEVMLETLVDSALLSAQLAEEIGLDSNKIILSAKVSSVPQLLEVYSRLAGRCEYPLHLGLTEAGMAMKGMVASTAALAILLQKGIGDTIRVSLTPVAGGDRCEEVRVAQQILQSLGMRSFTPQVTACPGCGRTTSTFFQELAEKTELHIRESMESWRKLYPGVEQLEVAVMGCIVNGPGESKHADIGISLPGSGEDPKAPVFVDGKLKCTLSGNRIAEQFQEILEVYLKERFAS